MSKSVRIAQIVTKAVLLGPHLLPWTHDLLFSQISFFAGILSHWAWPL